MTTRVTAPNTVTVQRMVDLIEREYADRVTLETVCAAIRGKPASLGPLFLGVVGVSVHQYLTRVRLEHAAHLIKSSMKIEAVALCVGYRSKKNFYRQFLRHFGVTPEAYRRRRSDPNGRPRSEHTARAAAGASRYAGLFDQTACVIDIEPRPNLNGRPSYVATPFVLLDHGIQPFAATAEFIEIVGETEAEAVERAAEFLEHRFGASSQPPKRQRDERKPAILTPRR